MDYDATWMARIDERLVEIGPMRLAEMDAAGVDVCVLSHTVPGVQGIVDADEAVAAARRVNDFLAAAVAKHPARFAGFASVALQDPHEAARELERAVTRLGLQGRDGERLHQHGRRARRVPGRAAVPAVLGGRRRAARRRSTSTRARRSSSVSSKGTHSCSAPPGASRPKPPRTRCASSTAACWIACRP